jgi:hypothetical protein
MSKVQDRLRKGMEPGQTLFFDDVRIAAAKLDHYEGQIRALKQTIQHVNSAYMRLAEIKIGR